MEGQWGRVVEIIQTAFRDRDLAEEVTWQAVVLIQNGKGDDRGIGLVEVMWKVVAFGRQLVSTISTCPLIITATTFHITSARPMPR